MQAKHLAIFALTGIILLLGFNMISSNQNENNRVAAFDKELLSAPIATNNLTSVTSKSFGEQPKLILDNATTQIAQAQQVDAVRLAQMESSQQ